MTATEPRTSPDDQHPDADAAEQFFRLSRDLFVVVGVDGYVDQVNPAVERALGWTHEELRAHPYVHFVHPDDRAATIEAIGRRMRGGDVTDFENRLRARDGSYRRLSWAASGPDEYGRVYGVGRDVTERHRVEEALRESERRFAHITANVPGMVYQFVYRPDDTMGYTFVSEGSRRMFGIAPEDALRDPSLLLDLVHPDDREPFRAVARAAAATSGSLHWEGRVLLPSGEERLVQIAARDQRCDDGTVLSDGLILDVTERRRNEEELRRSAERRRALFELVPIMVSFIDPQGRPVFVNREWERVSGWTAEEARTTDLFPRLFPDPADLARARAFMRASEGQWEDFQLRARDGRTVDIHWACVGLSDGSIVSISQDVTERRRLEHQVRQAQKMEAVGQLAGGVAHDFNNLLTVIQNYAAFIVADPKHEDVAVRTEAEEILKAAERAAGLTRQLLAFGRKQVLQPRIVDVNNKVTSLLGMLRRVIGEDIIVETELEPQLWPVRADAGQLEQVLMNLAVNARDAMPAGGTLRFRTANVAIDAAAARDRAELAPGEYVSVVVEDTGTGIDAAALPHIFEPFFTTKGPGKGTGLGLATAYGIVKQTGGNIYVDSTPRRGTTFTMLLPRADAPIEPAEPVAERALPRGTETILLVEDEAPVRAVAARMLERLGYTVCPAATAAEARRLAASPAQRIDLLVTDVVMPAEDGPTLGAGLATLRPGLRILFMSGYADDEVLRRGLSRPGAAFLEKPFTAERLAHAVRAALDAPRPRVAPGDERR